MHLHKIVDISKVSKFRSADSWYEYAFIREHDVVYYDQASRLG